MTELILCANYVMRKHFDSSKRATLIGVDLNRTEMDGVENLLQSLQWPIFFYKYFYDFYLFNLSSVLEYTQQLVVFSNSEVSIRQFLSKFKLHDFAPDAKLLIVMNHMLKYLSIYNILADCWEKKIWKVILLVPINGGVGAYANNRFDSQSCDNVKIELKDFWTSGRFNKNVHLYDSASKDMHGCPIFFAVNNETLFMKLSNNSQDDLVFYGVESEIILLLRDVYNFTIKILVSKDGDPWGSKLENGTYTGLLHLLDTGLAQVAVGGFFLTFDRAEDFDYTKGYHTSDVIWAVSNMITDGPWSRLISPFQSPVWYILGVLVLTSIICIMIIHKYYQSHNGAFVIYSTHNSYTILNMIALILAQQIRTTKQKCLKYFVVIFLFAFFILRTSYQGGLVKFLTGDMHITHPNSVQEMIEENYRFVINLHSIPDVASLYPNFKTVIIEDINLVFARLRLVDGEYKIALPFIRESIAEENQNNLHLGIVPVADEVINTLPVIMYLEKSSPYRTQFNSVINRINSAGLIKKFINKYFKQIDIENYYTSKEPVIISTQNLKGLFLIYIIGTLISIVVFFLELANNRHNNNFQGTVH